MKILSLLNPFWKRIILTSFSMGITVLLLTIIETAFWLSGEQAGCLYKAPVRFTDSHVFYDNYMVDEAGIIKFNQKARAEINAFLEGTQELSQDFYSGRENDITLKHLMISYSDFLLNKSQAGNLCSNSIIGKIKNVIPENRLYCSLQGSPFLEMVRGLKQKPFLTDLDSAYIQHCMSPINSDGFRSIEFKTYNSSKKKVLFIGDSFTYGFSASSLTNSFPEMVSLNGYISYNAGIPATDPIQYAQVAEKYIPILKPDVVCINFFMGNDIIKQQQNAVPFQHRFFATNSGYINAVADGNYLKDSKTAFEYHKKRIFVPFTQEKWFNTLCSKYIITTKFWALLCKIGFLGTENRKALDAITSQKKMEAHEHSWTASRLEKIKNICADNNTILLLVLIPKKQDLNYEALSFCSDIFSNIKPHAPSGFNESDFFGVTDHFNNQGHKKYSSFIVQKLDSIFMKTLE